MNTKFLTMARRLFCSDLVPQEINRANARKWVHSLRQLGAKWLLAEQMRKEAA